MKRGAARAGVRESRRAGQAVPHGREALRYSLGARKERPLRARERWYAGAAGPSVWKC